jgi:16S rRNA (cytosine967-C5)-methyltransferase
MKISPINSFALAHAQGVQDDGSVQLWTHQDQSDAMFMVLFEKVG